MSDLLKKIVSGSLIGLVVAIIIGWGTYEIPFIRSLFDDYEFVSYDTRMRLKVNKLQEELRAEATNPDVFSPEGIIEDVVIIDIDDVSVQPEEQYGLGRYYNWPQAYHGQLINSVASGNPAAIIFDIIFDAENTFNYNLVNALALENKLKNESLADSVDQFIINNDPNMFVEATYNSQKAYHSLVFEQEDSLSFVPKMDEEPEGYNYGNHIIRGVSDEAKGRLPSADRLGNTYTELLSASVGAGSANFPQDNDGVIRRAPTAIYFEGADHVYPSLVMSAAIDILGIKKDGGFNYDFDKNILNLIDTTNTIVRKIPIDDEGRMYVNYYGASLTFAYMSYVYSKDPEMLEPAYWTDKVALVGASLPGLMDLRNTPIEETFPGVEIHANVMYSK